MESEFSQPGVSFEREISKWHSVMERLDGFSSDDGASIDLTSQKKSLRHRRSSFLVDYYGYISGKSKRKK